MIYLTEEDILNAASVDEMLDAIEASMHLYEQKEFYMPQRLHVDHQGDVLLLMPCFTKDYFGTKVRSVYKISCMIHICIEGFKNDSDTMRFDFWYSRPQGRNY